MPYDSNLPYAGLEQSVYVRNLSQLITRNYYVFEYMH